MQSLKTILVNKTFAEVDKHISRDFQEFGLRLAQNLVDMKHKALYIKLAKTHDRKLLEDVLSFVVDSNANNKGALFMWKLKQEKDKLKSKK